MHSHVRLCVVLSVALTFTLCAAAQSSGHIMLIQPVKHDTSPRLSDLLPGPVSPERHVIPLYKPSSHGGGGGGGGTSFTDPLLQSSASGSAVSSFVNFAGQGTDSDAYAPPDTNGAAGDGQTNQSVQTVNTTLAVYSKSGTTLYGPVTIDTLWSGFGGSCASYNGGDPIVQFDKLNNRWVILQIQYSGFGSSGGDYLCIAVSQTDDATGKYNRYAFKASTLTDYPKIGIWTDGYYLTYNAFKGFGTFAGPVVCAFNSAQMIAGSATTPLCTGLSSSYSSLLPADIDSTSQEPVSGEPEYLAAMGTNSLLTWRYHVNWSAGTASLSAAQSLTKTQAGTSIAFQQACGGGTCIPQYNTTQQLDSLGDRLMYRLAYRNFVPTGGDHESLVVNQSVTESSSAATTGIRWYELRNTPSTNYSSPTAPVIYQAGTYAPNSNYRWMGSAAMDANGNIAIGYSESSSSMNPAIYVTGHCATDLLGQLRSETQILAGTGSQTGNLSRWGDYSSMSVDPSDGSLWYTTEYLKSDGSFNWHTEIANFTICP